MGRLRLVVLISLFAFFATGCSKEEVPVIKVGLVGHDHQVAALLPLVENDFFKTEYNLYLVPVKEEKFYDFYDGKKRIARIELVRGTSCTNVCGMIADGSLDIGFAGIGPIAFMVDKGKGMKCIAPLQSKGNILVAHPSVEAENWDELCDWIKSNPKQVHFGYRSPAEVANLIVQDALKAEGISFTFDSSDSASEVLFINMKGDKFAVPSLLNRMVDVYAGPTPWAQVVVHKGIGKKISNVQDLPPGIWQNHPCCAIGASEEFINKYPDIGRKYLELLLIGAKIARENIELTADVAAQWMHIPLEAELQAIPAVGFSSEPDKDFKEGTYNWYKVMQEHGRVKDKLLNVSKEEFEKLVYDFRMIEKALSSFQKEK